MDAEDGAIVASGGDDAENFKVRYRRSGPRPLEGGLRCPRGTRQEYTKKFFRKPWPSRVTSKEDHPKIPA